MTYLNEQFLRKHSTPQTSITTNRLGRAPLRFHHYNPMERYVSGPQTTSYGGGGKFKHRGSVGQFKYTNRDMILLPLKKPSMAEFIRRERCYYCREFYSVKDNVSGACKDAPDPIEAWIRRLTCYRCAQCAVFYCNRDDDGEYRVDNDDVCSCTDNISRLRLLRWTMLAVVAFFVPCLCCYWPMRAARCCCFGRAQRGRHKPCPMTISQSQQQHQQRSISIGRHTRNTTTSRMTSRLSSF